MRGRVLMAAGEYTDQWSAGREELVRDDPSLATLKPDAHEHVAHGGGFYVHNHLDGASPHSHTGPCTDPTCRHQYAPEWA